ncbi:MAG: hypothetical protein L3K17_10820, partial [Thermoplasmata archaeon]|nr:hypothetical protein [Thermoplasmata archaeon]
MSEKDPPASPPPRRKRRSWGAQLVGLWRVMRANPLTLFGFLLVALIAVTALVVAGLPAVTGVFGHPVSALPYNPDSYYAPGQPPSLSHPFGTDNLGRDMFSRVLAAL